MVMEFSPRKKRMKSGIFSPRFSNFTYFILVLFIILDSRTAISADSTDRAVDIIQSFCLAKSGSIEFAAEISGDLKLNRLSNTGIEGSVHLNKKEIEGVINELNSIYADQATQMRECMKPYIDILVRNLIRIPEDEQTETFSIDIDSDIFRPNEFNFIMCLVAVNHGLRFREGDFDALYIYSASGKRNDFPPILVRYYLDMAVKNELLSSNSSSPDRYIYGENFRNYLLRTRMAFGDTDCRDFLK